ncbi:hypothetical protein GPECTOR_50g605 [Gonium pectorale]|uniref:Chitin-binding type-4 domain-containing protein n=1 Tax=Gonium pectorale TaxID=33097 RepID=A0A150G7L3_GONPE|nr:hypothetical protein GPECTOR_50g605 [Gonium pectorale]|eukprot:KXZ45811.1 hypothetical protein GPECTOR_50g605 [Gonium pectorale]
MRPISPAVWAALAVGVLSAMACLPSALAHGYLQDPVSRNYAARLIGEYYCHHCGQGGGQWKQPDVCGNPFQDSPPINFTTRFYGFRATYTEGQDVNVTIGITTNHGGRMSLRVCPHARDQISQSCFDTPAHQMRRVHTNPQYNNKLYWYVRPGDVNITQTFRLPAGVSCAGGCVLQWWWVAYQFCYMPCGSDADDVPGECGRNLNFPVGQCTGGLLQTEQFNNCAGALLG